MGKYYRNSYLTLMKICKYQGGWRQTEKLKFRLKREIVKERETIIQRQVYLWENIIEIETIQLRISINIRKGGGGPKN